jgi:DNA helicase-2/ATP-dependent DNA helicase PcrA
MFEPREKQAEVLAYTGGRMGVSAVPGSGKTQTLSALAAKLVREANLEFDQEVLIVTLVNSAVENFKSRVAGLVSAGGLLPGVGYRVRTLHGLAHDIVRERPGLVGLSDDFQIVDDQEAGRIVHDAVQAWLVAHQDVAEQFLDPELDDRWRERVRREHWPALVRETAEAFIRTAKDLQQTPERLRQALDALPAPLPLLEMGWAIYESYQRSLAYRGGVDYQDLIRLALLALQLDAEFLARLQRRWPYILEDEAQDSSELQERILRLLAGPGGNWVRVGDPNQAIYESFTTASPQYLRRFLVEAGVTAKELPNSGRSMQSILDLANYLVDWSRAEHPVEAVRDALSAQHIEPTPPGDPQPNPPDVPGEVRLVGRAHTPEQEMAAIVDSLARWLPANPDRTAALLTLRNDRGSAFVHELQSRGLPYYEILRSSKETRDIASILGTVLFWLAEPTSATKLARACEAWRREDREDPETKARLETMLDALRRCIHVEDFLWPRPDADLPGCLRLDEVDGDAASLLREFREVARRWQSAVMLPIDQLMLTVAQDLFDRPSDLALSHKLAVELRQASDANPEWDLRRLVHWLGEIARNQRRYLGFSDVETNFDPEMHRGKVVITTAHKAKGLEWDRVYLSSVNSYDFPSALPGDDFQSEKWFIRDRLNLQAETLAQLRQAVLGDTASLYAPPGAATAAARIEYASERLRLLYVAITRAKRSLIMTWNTGRRGDGGIRAAAPFLALQTWWESRSSPEETTASDS